MVWCETICLPIWSLVSWVLIIHTNRDFGMIPPQNHPLGTYSQAHGPLSILMLSAFFLILGCMGLIYLSSYFLILDCMGLIHLSAYFLIHGCTDLIYLSFSEPVSHQPSLGNGQPSILPSTTGCRAMQSALWSVPLLLPLMGHNFSQSHKHSYYLQFCPCRHPGTTFDRYYWGVIFGQTQKFFKPSPCGQYFLQFVWLQHTEHPPILLLLFQ